PPVAGRIRGAAVSQPIRRVTTMRLLAAEGGTITAPFGSFDTAALWIIVGVSLLALAFAGVLRRQVLAASQGSQAMQDVSKAIQDGSAAYLRRQFRTLGAFGVVLLVVLLFLPVHSHLHSVTVVRIG